MSETLSFDCNQYEQKTCKIGDTSVAYRAYEGLQYCTAPVDPIQKVNLFVPEAYYSGGEINGYRRETAPIFIPNTVGGYMAGPADQPGLDRHGHPNSIFEALRHGYVVASPGIRGRTSKEFFEGGKAGWLGAGAGKRGGKAPALIVDLKAVVRYLRHNRNRIPGNTERIITNGTSAGGALSALAGATGNSPDYEPYLNAIGAADERDDIFAASCYCPIHNLENADAAYEWLFCGCDRFYRTKHVKTEHGLKRVPISGEMTEKQKAISKALKARFPAYLNSLHLTDRQGNALTLDAAGEGSFQAYIQDLILASAEKEFHTHDSAGRLAWLAVPDSEVEKQPFLTIADGKVLAMDWDGFVKAITRMKAACAFDALDLSNPENDEFGTETVPAKHFSAFSQENSEVNGQLADSRIVRMLNPTEYIGKASTAPHWRIRHGVYDRDTSLALPVILALLLENRGYSVDFFLPWGLPHSGDYDLMELFQWVDGICR